MKAIVRFLALVAALSVGWVANAQTMGDYTFYTGTSYYNWIDISSTTNLLGNTAGDGVSSEVMDIGFEFPFATATWRTVYTQFSVNSDGNLRLGGTVTGTENYESPFNSSNAGVNCPKINFFGCDGYFNPSIHYVHSEIAHDFLGNTVRVVEFCLGTWSSTTRNQQYKWQVQLYPNGYFRIVFPSTVPSVAPAVPRQVGVCRNASDGWVVNSNNVATHFTAGSNITWAANTWPDANRYYIFSSPCSGISAQDYYITPSTSWQTHSSSTSGETYGAYTCSCAKWYKIKVTPGAFYSFSTRSVDGGNADFPIRLTLYKENGSIIRDDNTPSGDYSNREVSLINYQPAIEFHSGFVYLRVGGLGGAAANFHGNYTLAYCCSELDIPNYHYQISPGTSWSTSSSSLDTIYGVGFNRKIYKLSVVEGATYTFSTGCDNHGSINFFSRMVLVNESATLLASDNECNSTYGRKLEYTATYTGTAYLLIYGDLFKAILTDGNNSRTGGNYTLAYKKDCPNNNTDYDYSLSASTSWSTHSTGTYLTCNGNIYRFFMTPDYLYTFKTGCGDDATADFDTYLQLYDNNGTSVSFNDDGCENGKSIIRYSPPSEGYYFLRVTGYNAANYGTYTLAYKKECKEIPYYDYTLSPNSTWKTHSSSTAGTCNGKKIYLTHLTGGQTYSFKTGCGNGATANFDTQIQVCDSAGNQLSIDDDFCESNRSLVQYTPSYTRDVYIVVKGWNDRTGSYTLAYTKGVNYSVSVETNPVAGGTVTGAGDYHNGTTCTLTATPATGYVFVNWTVGNTVVSSNANYSFIVNSNRSLVANFAPCSISAADLPYTDNFDTYTTSTTAKTGVEPDCWTLAHQYVTMTDEYKPMIYYNASYAHSGSYALFLNYRGIYAMPFFEGDVNTLQLSFSLRQSQAKFQLQVGVMDNLNDASSFTPVATFNNSSTGHEQVSVDFSSYTGSGHYIAFRNTLASGYSGNYSYNFIDDISLDLIPDNCTGISAADLPYTDNFDSYTTSTTAKTGVEPDCWTLAHQYVSMTDEYKPMVYYNASYAHSGSYALFLNYRGIYAMPYFDGDVNTLQLSFSLRQSQAKFRLQVGVMDNLNDASSFTPVATFNNSSTGHEQVSVDFSSYSGSGHYIAFRNTLASGYSGNYSYNFIDDITLSVAGAKGGMPDNNNGMEAPAHTLTLYPNPTTGILTVESDEEVVRVDVFDYTGRCVASFERQTTVDLGRLATGLYTLRVTLPERIEVRRVVKQ